MSPALAASHTCKPMSHSAAEAIIKEAREWIDTPYVHQARVKGVGVDCGQLIAGVALGVGIAKEVNIPGYSVEWHWHNNQEKMCEIAESLGCYQIPLEERQPGDILTFKIYKVQAHMGILVTPTRYVHAMNGSIGKVAEVELQGRMLDRLGRAYRFPEYQKD